MKRISYQMKNEYDKTTRQLNDVLWNANLVSEFVETGNESVETEDESVGSCGWTNGSRRERHQSHVIMLN